MIIQSISFPVKLFLTFFVITFSIYFQSWYYSLSVVSILFLIFHFQRLVLFRSSKQRHFFMGFLVLLFFFRSLNGFGKVWVSLPGHIVFTQEGVVAAFTFVLQMLIIFLLVSLAVKSTSDEEIWYYFHKLQHSTGKGIAFFQQVARIAMYVFYLIPTCLDLQLEYTSDIKEQIREKKGSLKLKLQLVLDKMSRFIVSILELSEQEYKHFTTQHSSRGDIQPLPVLNWVAGFTTVAVICLHLFILRAF